MSCKIDMKLKKLQHGFDLICLSLPMWRQYAMTLTCRFGKFTALACTFMALSPNYFRGMFVANRNMASKHVFTHMF